MMVNKTIIFIAVLFFLVSCQDIKEDPDPPLKPEWVEKSLPEALVERGIDSDNTGQDQIFLMWKQNTDDDLAGYEIYRADINRDNQYNKIKYIDILEFLETDTIFIDESVSNYVDYYYFLRAIDNSDNYSKQSDTISYRLINHPDCISPADSTYSPNLTFKWMDRASNFEFSTEYVIRVENVEMNQTVWVARFTNIWYGYENAHPISYSIFDCNRNWPDNVLACNALESNLSTGLYRWKIKAISEVDNHTNIDEASGESEWTYFYVE